MMVLISYDVSTVSAAGKTRLRKVAKECQNHAQRVQNSVFEADLDYSSFLKLKDSLRKILYLIFDYPHKHYTFKYFAV